MNTRFRCAGCREYRPAPAPRRIGNVQVCSEDCATRYRMRTNKRTAQRRRAQVDEPTQEVREKVLARDGYVCRFDGAHTADHVHHINYRSQGVDHSEHNLISLCVEHHELVHSAKKKWQPLLRAVIWSTYVNRRPTTVVQIERRLHRRGFRV